MFANPTLLLRAPALLALVVSGLALFSTPGATRADGGVAQVDIAEYKFTPAELTVKPGDRVRWTNREKRTSHSIRFAAEGLPESDRLFPDESWERTFAKPGIYPYSCGPHPEMKGVIRVE